jgi:hypothetical protein
MRGLWKWRMRLVFRRIGLPRLLHALQGREDIEKAGT